MIATGGTICSNFSPLQLVIVRDDVVITELNTVNSVVLFCGEHRNYNCFVVNTETITALWWTHAVL